MEIGLSALLLALAASQVPELNAPPTPLQPLHLLLTSDDYPSEAIAKQQQGSVRVRLDITGEGRVRGCTVLLSSRSSSLDATTCRIMMSRARFAPATADGEPRFLESNFTWRLARPLEVPAKLQGAIGRWSNCVSRVTDRHSKTLMTIEQVVQKSLSSCAEHELSVLAALSESGIEEVGPVSALQDLRNQLKTHIVADVGIVRKGRKRYRDIR